MGKIRGMSARDSRVPPLVWGLALLVSAPLWIPGLLPVLYVLSTNLPLAAVVASLVAAGFIRGVVRWVNRRDSRPPVEPPLL